MKLKIMLLVAGLVAWITLMVLMMALINGVYAYSELPEYDFVVAGGIIMGVLLTIGMDAFGIIVTKVLDRRKTGVLLTIAYDTCIYIFLRLTDRKRVHEREKDR